MKISVSVQKKNGVKNDKNIFEIPSIILLQTKKTRVGKFQMIPI